MQNNARWLCCLLFGLLLGCSRVSYLSPPFVPDAGEVKEPAWYVVRTLLDGGGAAQKSLETTALPAWKKLRADGSVGAVHVLSFVRHRSKDERETSTKDYDLVMIARVRDEATGQRFLALERDAIKATGGDPDAFYKSLKLFRVDLMQATRGAFAPRPTATSANLPEVEWEIDAIAAVPAKIGEFHQSVARTDGLATRRLVEQGRVIAFLPLELKSTLDGPTHPGVRWNSLQISALPKGRGGLRLSLAKENALDEVAPQIGYLRLRWRYRKLREVPREDVFREVSSLRLGAFY
jgi:hypothetical protein